ncbi:MAG: translation initiation factor IF-2 [Clostridia bacterium]|nr:translation initiation factor IF-2 [Clostridia bacterium]
MTKVKLKDATRELAADAAKVRDDASRIRNNAANLLKSLKSMEEGFVKADAEREAEKKRAEQQKKLSDQSRAYVMLDADEQAQVDAAAAEAARVKETRAAAEAAKNVKPAPKAEEAPKAAQPAKPAEPKAERKPAEAPAKPAEVKAEQPKAAEVKVEAKPEVKAEPKPEVKAEVRAEVKPEAKAEAPKPAPKAEEPRKPAIGQIISRPGQEAPQRPVGLAPNVIRPPRPQQPRPQAAPGQMGQRPQQGNFQPRPQGAPGQMGQRPQGGFAGRPQQGNFQPRPQGAPGQMGQRPQQGGFAGRPQQGNFQPRPQGANGPMGQRPQGPGMGGPRPAGGGQGGFNRPAGGPGGRPMGGGMGRPKPAAPDLTPAMGKERVSNYDPNKKQYVRQHDPEHVARNRKQLSRDAGYSGYDDDVIRGGKKARKKPSAQQMMAPIKIETAYMSGDTIIVRDLCEKIGKTSGEIIKKLFLLGNMATINSEIDFDTASLVCADFEITLEKKQEQTAEDQLTAEDFEDTDENLMSRPPVVTIMGHVDHGKTSLLDYIRKSRVTAGEAGGITQHIGAYTVKVDDERQITFLDTPGHEAFTAMRARGTQATDIAILVVAADDSVMPQTVESINHAKAAEVPLIVAINKIDKPTANPERVKQDLTNYGIVCEEWGGDVIMVPVSAHTGEGIDELLEMVLLQAETMELRANPNRLARGVIVEAKLDKARGPLATVLLQNGTLHVGDNIIAGMASGRVRALINDKGEKVKEAGPSMPVEIMGFDEVPSAGDEMIAVGDDHLSRQVAEERKEKLKASREASMAKMSMENLFSNLEAGKMTTLNLIIKADVQGSVEAVKQAMEKLTNDEVRVRVLHSAAGAVTKDDVNLASAFNAIIIGFNVRPDSSAREVAAREKVDVRLYTVIYKAIEDMELAMKGLLAPEYKEVILGHAEVRAVMKITGAGIIAGSYVTDGKMQRNAQVRLLRENVVVHEGKLSSLKHYKEDVKEMKEGFECGMSLEGHNDIKEGDIIECFIMEEIPR